MPYRAMPKTERLPQALYRAEQVQQFDRLAIEQFGLPASSLMRRAAESAFAAVQARYPEVKSAVFVIIVVFVLIFLSFFVAVDGSLHLGQLLLFGGSKLD